MNQPHPTALTARQAKRRILALADAHDLPRPRRFDATPSGDLSLVLASPADVDAWAAHLGVHAVQSTDTYLVVDRLTLPDLPGWRVDVCALTPFADPDAAVVLRRALEETTR